MGQRGYQEQGLPTSKVCGLFGRFERPVVTFPIKRVEIDWERLQDMRPIVLATVDQMPRYMLRPEVLELLGAEKDPTYRLILDLMWSTGATVSEVLALTRDSFYDEAGNYGVILKTIRQGLGRACTPRAKNSPKRYVPIVDSILKDRVESYLYVGRFKRGERLFPMTRQTVNRHIHALIKRLGGAPFAISAHTFRHSFAIHLLLHGRPLKYVSQLLGHRSVNSTEIYTNVLTIGGEHFLEGVDFH